MQLLQGMPEERNEDVLRPLPRWTSQLPSIGAQGLVTVLHVTLIITHLHPRCFACGNVLKFWWLLGGCCGQKLGGHCTLLHGLDRRDKVFTVRVCEKIEVVYSFCFARKHSWGNGEDIIFAEHAFKT